MLAVRGKTACEAENFSNGELSKITASSKSDKITFHEEKFKVLLISRRKRKETKETTVHLNNKPMEQVNTIKYLGIIIDKFKFNEYIRYAAKRCTKLIHILSKSAKISWGLKHEALKPYIYIYICIYIYIRRRDTITLTICTSSLDRSVAVRTQQTKVY
jgi:hypothetical protein